MSNTIQKGHLAYPVNTKEPLSLRGMYFFRIVLFCMRSVNWIGSHFQKLGIKDQETAVALKALDTQTHPSQPTQCVTEKFEVNKESV